MFVIDEDVSARELLKALIESAGWQPETFRSGREFLSRSRVPAPSCLVLEIALPDLNGLELLNLVADRTEMPVIFVAGHCDVSTTVRAMKAGAAEVLTKPFAEDALVGAIRNAIDRSRSVLEQVAKMQALHDRYAALSRREREVMALVVVGLLNKQVGAELGISEITVKAHRGKMMRKMQARSLPALVLMAAKLGPVNWTSGPPARLAPKRRHDGERLHGKPLATRLLVRGEVPAPVDLGGWRALGAPSTALRPATATI